jgi:hypothetical protein
MKCGRQSARRRGDVADVGQVDAGSCSSMARPSWAAKCFHVSVVRAWHARRIYRSSASIELVSVLAKARVKKLSRRHLPGGESTVRPTTMPAGSPSSMHQRPCYLAAGSDCPVQWRGNRSRVPWRSVLVGSAPLSCGRSLPGRLANAVVCRSNWSLQWQAQGRQVSRWRLRRRFAGMQSRRELPFRKFMSLAALALSVAYAFL